MSGSKLIIKILTAASAQKAAETRQKIHTDQIRVDIQIYTYILNLKGMFAMQKIK